MTVSLPAVLSPEIAPASGVRTAGIRSQIARHRRGDAESPLHVLVGVEVTSGKINET